MRWECYRGDQTDGIVAIYTEFRACHVNHGMHVSPHFVFIFRCSPFEGVKTGSLAMDDGQEGNKFALSCGRPWERRGTDRGPGQLGLEHNAPRKSAHVYDKTQP